MIPRLSPGKTIEGAIPGSEQFQAVQKSLQPPADSTDVVAVIKGVIDAEDAAAVTVSAVCDEFLSELRKRRGPAWWANPCGH